MKKAIKIISIVFLLIIAVLVITPIFFKEQLKQTIITQVDEMLNAEFSINDVSISLISNFPEASITLEEVLIKNNAPFEGDTLVYIKSVSLHTSISNLLAKKLIVDNFSVSDGLINLKTNTDNISNYDIMDESNGTEIEEERNTASDIALHIENYSFKNIDFNYLDEKSSISLTVKNFTHFGTGTFSMQDVLLNTQSSIESLSFSSENIYYLKNSTVDWKANINVNLNTLKVEFKENIAKLNDLKLSFHGFLQPNDEGIEMDINFDSKGSKFKSLLSLIPSAYSKDFASVEAKGALNFDGMAAGLYSDNTIPTFAVNITTNNASFHYPDLPKEISDIYIDTHIKNTTGKIDDTKVSINRFDLQIEEDSFKASSYLSNLTTNPHIIAKLKGSMNLDNLTKAYPLELEETLKGIMKFNLQTEFTQNAIENELYEEIKNSGDLSIAAMTVSTEMLPNPLIINEAKLEFTPKYFILKKFNANTATSDFNAKGTLTNLFGFVFGDKHLKGDFSVNSNSFNVFDFLSDTPIEEIEETKTENTTIEAIKIPANIDISTKITVKKVTYDNIILADMKGVLDIVDQKAVFKNTTAKMLGGTISLKGNVNTKPTPSNFDFSMNLKELDIVESFSTIELFSSIAPFAQAFNGKMTTTLDLKGDLDAEFFPDTNSLTGNGFSKLQVKEIDTKKSNALSLLESNFKGIDLSKLNMKKVQTFVKFENSAVSFKPFKVATYDGTPIQMEGSHNFDNTMNYKLSTDIPVSLLGKDATKLLSGLPKEEIENMKVPINIKMSGAVNKPSVTPDYSKALKVVSSKVIESQTNNLVNNLFKDNKKESDSTSNTKNKLEETAKNLLKGLF